MGALLQSPFFVLFCAASAVGAYLGHRLFVLKVKPGFADRGLALVGAMLALALSFATYQIRRGTFPSPRIDATAASIVAALTGLGIAFVCIECVLSNDESAE